MSKIALNILGLTKTYGRSVKALKSIDLQVPQGAFFGLLGENGAGKTTTIGIVTDLVKKDSGIVEVFGSNIDTDLINAKKQVAVVPQEFNFNIFEKVEDILAYQAGYYGIPKAIAKKRIDKLLKDLGLEEKRHTISLKLSGGMKRRLMIARALILEPKLLILDEPTAGVDVLLRQETWSYLKKLNKQGITILLTTHYLEEAEYLCDTIAVIKKGEIIISDKKDNLLKSLSTQSYSLEFKSKPKKLDGYDTHIKQAHMRVNLQKHQSLSQLLKDLPKSPELVDIKHSQNRLEQVYLDLLKTKQDA